MQALDDMICAILRGEQPPWHGADRAVLARANYHGVSALLHSHPGTARWPPAVRAALRDRAVQLAAWEIRHHQLLVRTLAALADSGVRPVLIKGTALAYSLYQDPALRTRGDTDLLVPPELRTKTHEVLIGLGYELSLAVAGDSISYQASYTQHTSEGSFHALDLHWRINNSELLSRLFDHQELMRESIALPDLGPHARGPSLAHSLLIACMHRATHRSQPYYVDQQAQHDPDRLIWLTDIRLIVEKLSPGELQRAISMAQEKGLAGTVAQGLQRAQATLSCAVSDQASRALADVRTPQQASIYLSSGALRQQWMDFRALGNWTRRGKWIRESLFPPAAYIRRKYPVRRIDWLPWLYLRRAAGGVLKRVAHNTRP